MYAEARTAAAAPASLEAPWMHLNGQVTADGSAASIAALGGVY